MEPLTSVLLSALLLAHGSGSHANARYATAEDPRQEPGATSLIEPAFSSDDVAVVPPAIPEEAFEEERPEESIRSDSLLAVAQAQAAAKREVNKLTWFGVGCTVNMGGFAIATLTTSPPPESRLLGRSPEYVEAFTAAYRVESRRIQMVYAGWGCATSTAGCCIVSYIVLIDWSKSLAEAIWLAIFESLFDTSSGN